MLRASTALYLSSMESFSSFATFIRFSSFSFSSTTCFCASALILLSAFCASVDASVAFFMSQSFMARIATPAAIRPKTLAFMVTFIDAHAAFAWVTLPVSRRKPACSSFMSPIPVAEITFHACCAAAAPLVTTIFVLIALLVAIATTVKAVSRMPSVFTTP